MSEPVLHNGLRECGFHPSFELDPLKLRPEAVEQNVLRRRFFPFGAQAPFRGYFNGFFLLKGKERMV